MSQKQKIKAILAKLKSWSELMGDEELDGHISELETEINATYDPADDGDDTGGSAPPPEKGRG